MRINARIGEEQVKQLERIKKKENISTTQVIKRALDIYFQQQNTEQKAKLDRLLTSDFIGCAEGSAQLSTDYKQSQLKTLDEKHHID